MLTIIVNLNDRLRKASERGSLGEMRKLRTQARTVDLPAASPLVGRGGERSFASRDHPTGEMSLATCRCGTHHAL
ncbi:hypothetical protein AB0F91_40370 [Amycolatopsis sp. NPDC023774]|uniref:hypothetical protein n=1 Tax=Amycolatopsis sp. NPDC023774 TaxID=3155015 RepID=UPI00340B7E95